MRKNTFRNIDTIINDYYVTFYSYRGMGIFYSVWLWIFISMISLSISSIYLLYIHQIQTSKKSVLATFFFSFFVALFSWAKITWKRDEHSIYRAQKSLMSNEASLLSLKKIWLDKFLPYESHEYIDLIGLIEKSTQYKESYRDAADIRIKEIISKIIPADSKPRILALFLALATSIMALSISAGAKIDDVYKVYNSLSRSDLIFFLIVTPLTLIVFCWELKMIFIFLFSCFERISERISGSNIYSYRRRKIFIIDLLQSFSLKKPRMRI